MSQCWFWAINLLKKAFITYTNKNNKYKKIIQDDVPTGGIAVGTIWSVCGEVCDSVSFAECAFVSLIARVSAKLHLSNLGEIKSNEKSHEIITVHWHLLFHIQR